MSNPLQDYKTTVRANPFGEIEVDGFYFRVNDKRFVTYWEAEGYLKYLQKFDTDIANGFIPDLTFDFVAENYEVPA